MLFFTYRTWRRLPELTIRGDGFVYLISQTHHWFFSLPLFFTGFETSAVSFGWLFSHLYGAHIPYYLLTGLIVMLGISLLFYLFAFLIFSKRIAAFAAAIIFSISYYGQWDMYSTHCYCFFLERIIPMLLILPSLVFLQIYLVSLRKTAYYLSLVFYFFGVGISHFTVLFTTFFVAYPMCYFLFTYPQVKQRIKGVLVGLSYASLSIFFILIQQINEKGHDRPWGGLEFFVDIGKYHWPEKILIQLVHWSTYSEHVNSQVGLIVFLYISAACVTYAMLPKFRGLLIAAIIGILGNFYLNAYFGQYEMLTQPGPNRYLYFPTYLLSLFWGLFLYAVFLKSKNTVTIIVGLFLVVIYYYANNYFITRAFDESIYFNRPAKTLYGYLVSIRDTVTPDTVIITPAEIGFYESTFFSEQLWHGSVKITQDIPESSMSAHAIRLYYNKTCNCVTEETIK